LLPRASESIVQKIREHSEKLVELTEKKFHFKLDHSEESLAIMDDLVTIFLKVHREHYIKAAVMLGSYLGETIIHNLGGKWLKDLSIGKVGKLKAAAHPMIRARKRIANGNDDSLVTYYKNLKLTSQRDSTFAEDKKKLDSLREMLKSDKWDRELLERMMSPGESRYVREEAAELLGRIGGEDLKEELVRAAGDRQMVYYAAIALQNLPLQEAYEPLLKNLRRCKDTSVRQQILMALGQIKDPRAIDEIIEYLDDEDEIVGHFAAIAIGKIGGDGAVNKLLAIMAGLRPGKRSHAITALEILGDQNAVPALIEALFSRDDEIREAAARALQYIPDERAFKPLLYCLNDRSSRIRIYAAYALAFTGQEDALKHIQVLLTDEVQTVRLHAAHLVKWLKTGGLPQAKVI
jgi:HEAT repeat protein